MYLYSCRRRRPSPSAIALARVITPEDFVEPDGDDDEALEGLESLANLLQDLGFIQPEDSIAEPTNKDSSNSTPQLQTNAN